MRNKLNLADKTKEKEEINIEMEEMGGSSYGEEDVLLASDSSNNHQSIQNDSIAETEESPQAVFSEEEAVLAPANLDLPVAANPGLPAAANLGLPAAPENLNLEQIRLEVMMAFVGFLVIPFFALLYGLTQTEDVNSDGKKSDEEMFSSAKLGLYAFIGGAMLLFLTGWLRSNRWERVFPGQPEVPPPANRNARRRNAGAVRRNEQGQDNSRAELKLDPDIYTNPSCHPANSIGLASSRHTLLAPSSEISEGTPFNVEVWSKEGTPTNFQGAEKRHHEARFESIQQTLQQSGLSAKDQTAFIDNIRELFLQRGYICPINQTVLFIPVNLAGRHYEKAAVVDMIKAELTRRGEDPNQVDGNRHYYIRNPLNVEHILHVRLADLGTVIDFQFAIERELNTIESLIDPTIKGFGDLAAHLKKELPPERYKAFESENIVLSESSENTISSDLKPVESEDSLSTPTL